MKKACLMITITAILVCAQLYVHASDNVGKVLQIINDVDITSLTTGEKTVPEIGSIIKKDQRIRTGKRSFVEVILNNGTRLKVNEVSVLSISSIKITPVDEPTRIRLLTGKVRVALKKIHREGTSLVLNTPTAIAGVRGTDFGVISSLTETKIIVFDGSLDVASNDAAILKSYNLRSREETDVKKGRPPTRPRTVPEEIAKQWFDIYEIDDSNRIIKKGTGDKGFIDRLLRKRHY